MSVGNVMRGGTASVAYQGGPGANSEAAIVARWNGRARPVPVRTFGALAAAVADGGVDFGVVPVWNSTIGEVREGCAALEAHAGRLAPVGDVTIGIRHALLALPGTTLDMVRAVGSHAAALAQCGRFLRSCATLVPVDAWSTAGAAHELVALASRARGGAMPDDDSDGDTGAAWHAAVPQLGAESLAVIANRAVAARLGLAVLADDIQDHADNATRFAVVRSREATWGW